MADAVLQHGITIEKGNGSHSNLKVFTNPTNHVPKFCAVTKSNLCICHTVMLNAYQLPCGHNICEKIYKRIGNASEVKCPIGGCLQTCSVEEVIACHINYFTPGASTIHVST